MIKITAIKKLSNESSKVACQDAYGDGCHPATDMGWYGGMLAVTEKTSPQNLKRIVEVEMEIESVKNNGKTIGRRVCFRVPCNCSRVYFHIFYNGRFIEYNGAPDQGINIYDAPVVTDIGATMILVPYL